MAIAPVTASMAALWSATAASPSSSEPEALMSLAGVPELQSGMKAGTSIMPAPCAVDIMQDHSISPVCVFAGWRARRHS